MDDLQELIENLLGRKEIAGDTRLMQACTRGKAVMVTGAGGSIGSELCRQLASLDPGCIVLFERSELALYDIESELNEYFRRSQHPDPIKLVPILGSIRNTSLVEKVISRYSIDTIYHAAAYKQVPMLERNVIAGVQNNIFGTMVLARAAEKFRVENFILVSTDKAVRPVNVMGATKRFSEQILQAMNTRDSATRFSIVRFGNVLGSSGSVIPLFRRQIAHGGPVTVTHPEVTRYFMTIREAAQLVIQAGSLARGGEVFVLDMSTPINITDMARKMIAFMGYEVCDSCPGQGCSCSSRGIPISFTGLREGEKLHEELLIGRNVAGTAHPKILMAQENFLDWETLQDLLRRLEYACTTLDKGIVRSTLAQAIEGFGGRISVIEQESPVSTESDKERELANVSAFDTQSGKVTVLSH